MSKTVGYICDLCGVRYDKESSVNWYIGKSEKKPSGIDKTDYDLCPECQIKLRTFIKQQKGE